MHALLWGPGGTDRANVMLSHLTSLGCTLAGVQRTPPSQPSALWLAVAPVETVFQTHETAAPPVGGVGSPTRGARSWWARAESTEAVLWSIEIAMFSAEFTSPLEASRRSEVVFTGGTDFRASWRHRGSLGNCDKVQQPPRVGKTLSPKRQMPQIGECSLGLCNPVNETPGRGWSLHGGRSLEARNRVCSFL